jgi:hypothetical protein
MFPLGALWQSVHTNDGAVELDMGVQVELGNIRPQIVHIFRK